MKTVGYAAIFILFIAIFGGLNYYIGLRVWQAVGSRVTFINSRVYWVLFWVIALSYVLAKTGERFLPSGLEDYLNIIGGYWMAAMLYFLLVLPVLDILRIAHKKFAFMPRSISENNFLKTYAGALIVLLVIGILIYGTFNARYIKVATYDIDISKDAGSLKQLKVVMISDSHLGNVVNNSRLTKIVDKINELKPDIVLMAGDIVDEKVGPFINQKMGENFKRLNASYGVYASTGNHEFYGGEAEDIVRELEKSKVVVLRDDYVKVADSFYIVGREDTAGERFSKEKRKKLSQILEGVDKNLPILLMDHNPQDIIEPQENMVDLQVSGHTHRGQMFPSQFITSSIYELDWGYLKKDKFNLIVSSGVGTWGPPIRVGNSSEIVQINIKFNK
jgi:predicted MPP superfamily phosphohydrolase